MKFAITTMVVLWSGVVSGDSVHFLWDVNTKYETFTLEVQSIDFDGATLARTPTTDEWSKVLHGWSGVVQGSRDTYACQFRDWDLRCVGSKTVISFLNWGKPDGLNWQEQDGQLVNASQQFADAWEFARAQPSTFMNDTHLRAVVVDPSEPPSYDLNNDGSIDAGDAGLLFGAWTGDIASGVPEPSLYSFLPIIFALIMQRKSTSAKQRFSY